MSRNYGKFSNRDNAAESTVFAFLFLLGVISITLFGIYYGSATAYTEVWDTSKLISGSVGTSSDGSNCNKDCYFYLQEHFQRYSNSTDPENDFCTVIRQTPHFSSTAVANEISALELGTFRKIYYYSYSSFWGTCADDKFMSYYMAVSWSLFGISMSSFGLCVTVMIWVAGSVWLEEFQTSGLTMDNSTLSNATNLSSSYCCSSWNRFWYLADLDKNGTIDFTEFFTVMGHVLYGFYSSFIKNLWCVIKWPFATIYNYCYNTEPNTENSYTSQA